MNKKVSVIVPTYNSEQFLRDCLQSIVNQDYKNIELIVVDKNSIDKTKEIAREFTKKVFNKEPERSAQRNHGVEQSSGDYVLIIDSDMKLSKSIISDSIKKCEKNKSIKGVVIPEESFGDSFWAQCKKLERSFYVGIDWMEAARFFRRDVFDEMNGYDEGGTGAEDYDLPQRIESKYSKKSIVSISAFIYHNEKNTTLWTTCKKRFYYGKNLNRYKSVTENVEKFKKQSSILQRYKLFLSHPSKLFKNPLIGLGMLIMKTCEFVCGGTGMIVSKFI